MKRIKKLQKILKEKKLDAFYVTKPENVRYLSGFTGTSGQLFITRRKAVLITDFRYLTMAKRVIPKQVEIFDCKKGMEKLFKRCPRVGFEGDSLSYSGYQHLKSRTRKYGCRLVSFSGIIEKMRMIKDADEIKIIREAFSIANEVYNNFVKTIKIGQSEEEMEWNLLKIVRESGGEGFSFDPIICFGKDTSEVHHVKNSLRRLKKGERVLLDFGIKYRGYCTDMTRIYFINTKLQDDIYSIVQEANRKAIQSIKAGRKLSDVDRAARDVIEKAGFGEYFGHSTGHGVGLEIHEEPKVSEKSDLTVKYGMVFTIEPGIYIEGKGGVRIEDTVLITNKGVEILTNPVFG